MSPYTLDPPPTYETDYLLAIDYINDLLSERSNLLSRLHHARSLIPSSQLPEQAKIPLWEREWKGGDGKEDGGDDEEDEEEDES